MKRVEGDPGGMENIQCETCAAGVQESFRIKGAIPGDLKFQGLKATACCKSKSSLWFSPEARACFYCSHHPPKNSDTSTSCLVQALAGEVVMGLFLEITL